MAKSKERLLSRKFRKQGLGVKTIAHRLHVSSSTVSLWCRDICLSDEQVQTLQNNSHDPYYGTRLKYIQKQQNIRLQKIEKCRKEGIKEVGTLSKRELFILGVGLYWGEGFKKDNLVGFANSDPAMIRFFLRWFTVCCRVPKTYIKVRLGLNEQYKEKVREVQNYWMSELGLSQEQFQKPFFQKVQWKKIYEHPEEYHGVLRVRVAKSTDLLRKIHGWIEGLQLSTK
jgi:hypothetical protein